MGAITAALVLVLVLTPLLPHWCGHWYHACACVGTGTIAAMLACTGGGGGTAAAVGGGNAAVASLP